MNLIKKVSSNNLSIRSKDSTAGITLIALVITIIVLLILAGVAISMLSGENGILRKAADAKTEYEDAEVAEQVALNTAENTINEYTMTDEEKELEQIKSLLENDIPSSIDESVTVKYTFSTDETTKQTYNTNIQTYIPKYNPNQLTLTILKGNVLCVQSDVMTPEKIDICEEKGIYLLGDINEDGIVNDYDIAELYAGIKEQFASYTDRQKLVADADQSGLLNDSDANTILLWTQNLLNPEVDKMKTEFETAMAKEGENRDNITVTEYEEVKKYIPSYTDSKYNLAILKGNLVCYTNDGIREERITILEEQGIYLFGDVNKDKNISKRDVTYIEDYLLGDETPTGARLERFLIVADVNLDGEITEADMTKLETMY